MDKSDITNLSIETKKLKVLYVEDDENTRMQFLKILKNFFDYIDIAIDGQDGLEQYKKQNNKSYDLVISDINMPKINGIDMSNAILEINPSQKIIILSANNDSKSLNDLIDIGISYFLHKPVRLHSIIPLFQKIVKEIQQEKQENEAFNNIQELNYELDAFIDTFDTHVIASRTDLKGVITYASKAYQEISGYGKEELIGSPHNMIRHPDMPTSALKDLWETIHAGNLWVGEVKNLRKDGSFYWVKASISPYYNKNGEHVGYSAIRLDITAQKEIEELHNSVNNLLNNIKEGVLLFDIDMNIKDEYSQKCLNIFDKTDISDIKIDKLLFPNKNSKEKMIFNKGFSLIKESISIDEKLVYITLLPKEIYINNKNIELDYKMLDNNNFMLTLLDITKKKTLKEKIKNQEQIQKMIVSAVSNKNELVELKSNFTIFLTKMHINCIENISQFLYDLHTFKGMFSQKEMVHTVNAIHNLESDIKTYLDQKDNSNISELLNIVKQSSLKQLFQKDMDILTDTLGEHYFETIENDLRINILNKLEEKLNILIEQEVVVDTSVLNNLLYDVIQLGEETLYSLLTNYSSLVSQIAEKLNKQIYPMDIKGDHSILVPTLFKKFLRTLIHIFRNSIDHGIEDADTRFNLAKDEKGSIDCEFLKEDNNIIIRIADDGSGINIDKVINKVIKNDLLSQNELDKLNDMQKLELVFLDNISTRDEVTQLSGRGIGLATVKTELSKLNGKIKIINNIGEGTLFQFTIPLHNKNLTQQDELDIIIQTAQEYFKNTLLLDSLKVTNLTQYQPNHSVTTIYLSGGLDGIFVFEIDDSMLNYLANILIPDGFLQEESEEIMEDVPKEILNTFIGLSIHNFTKKNYNSINISVPATLNVKDIEKIVKDSKNYTSVKIKTSKGECICSLIK